MMSKGRAKKIGRRRKKVKIEEASRRGYLKILGGTLGGLIAGASVVWLFKPSPPFPLLQPPLTVTETTATTTTTTATLTQTETAKEKTVTETVTTTVGKLPFEGETIVVASPTIPHAYAFSKTRDRFLDEAGIKVEAIEVPVEKMYEEYMKDFKLKSGRYDVIQFKPTWIGGYSRYLEPLVPLSERHGLWLNTIDLVPTWRDLQCSWDGIQYGMPCDGEALLLYWRKDLFEHPDEMDAFEKRFGYKLGPPTTLEQYRDAAEFFTRKAGETLAGSTLNGDFYGHAEAGKRGRMYLWYLWRFGALGGIYFDEEMNPLINTDIGIKALQHMLETLPFAPPEVLKYEDDDLRAAYLKGSIAMCYQRPSLGKAAEDPGESSIIGKTGYALGPRPVMTSGWALGIPQGSKHKGAAITYLHFISSPEISSWLVKQPEITWNPWRISHFKDPELRAMWDAAGDWLDVTMRSAESGFPYLQILGEDTYMDALDVGCSRCLAGEVDATTALNEVAKSWNDITDRLGRDDQRKKWLTQLEVLRKLRLV